MNKKKNRGKKGKTHLHVILTSLHFFLVLYTLLLWIKQTLVSAASHPEKLFFSLFLIKKTKREKHVHSKRFFSLTLFLCVCVTSKKKMRVKLYITVFCLTLSYISFIYNIKFFTTLITLSLSFIYSSSSCNYHYYRSYKGKTTYAFSAWHIKKNKNGDKIIYFVTQKKKSPLCRLCFILWAVALQFFSLSLII